MKAIKQKISSVQITGFLIIVILVGIGVQFISTGIELNPNIVFMDLTLGLLTLVAGVKFVTELD
jgi:hypothetical protein